MFGFVKKLLGKKADSTESAVQETSSSSKTPTTGSSAPAAGETSPVPVSARGTSFATSHSAKAGNKKSGAAGAASSEGNDTVSVSLIGVVGILPAELKPARALGDVASIQLSFPSRPLLEQLSHGCVRVTFGELRKLAPAGFFTAGSEHDQKLIELPLQEVLPQLQTGSYAVRSGQRSTKVPEEVSPLFTSRNGGPTRSGTGNTSITSKNQVPPASTSAGNGGSPAPSATRAPGVSTGGTMLFTRPPGATDPGTRSKAAGAGPATTSSSTQAKAAESAKSSPIPAGSGLPRPSAEGKAASPAPSEAPAPAPDPAPPVSKPIAAPNLLMSMKGQAATPATSNGNAGSAKTSAPSSVPTGETTSVSLQALSGHWSEAIRAEIEQWGLAQAQVALPSHEIEAALKQGRVQYPWQKILGFLEGGVGQGKSSSSPQEILDLPLQVVAPAFLAKRRPGAASSQAAKVAPDQSIPDLFHGGKPATPAAPAAAAPASTPASSAPATPTIAPAPAASASPKAATPSAATRSGNTGTFSKNASPTPAPAAGGTTHTPAPAQAPAQVMSIPLAMVDETWFEALKSEIARSGAAGLKIELPVEEINRALKAGKIEYPWKQIRSWISPALAPDVAADFGEKMLTLPLKVIAPMFLGQFKPGRAQNQKKLDCGSDIPDLFTGTPLAATPAAPASAPAAEQPASSGPAKAQVEALQPLVSDISGSGSTTQFVKKAPTDLGELFGQPGKRQWTPNDIVQNTARIRGVMGAVIAMQDGLLVAAHLPGSWKPDATAAFLPQIYSRLSQYLKELNTGELQSVSLTTGTGTLLIYNVGIIYFAVIGKPNETVPPDPIKLIVSELSRHTK